MLYKNIDIDTVIALIKEYEETLENDELITHEYLLTQKGHAEETFDGFLQWFQDTYGSTSSQRETKTRKSIAVDFDGVLHQYNTPIDIDEQHIIADPPVPCALDWVNETLEHFNVIVYTARHASSGGIAAVEEWLKKWGFPDLPVTGTKPVARLYLDDRGIQFTGGNWPSMEYMNSFQPWNREKRWTRE